MSAILGSGFGKVFPYCIKDIASYDDVVASLSEFNPDFFLYPV